MYDTILDNRLSFSFYWIQLFKLIFFFKFQLILRLQFNCSHITDITWINLWAFPCGFFIFKVGKTVSLKVVKIGLLNTVFCYSLKDCISTALTSLASLGLTWELFFAEFPWSTADGKMMFIFLFNCSLICRWTSDQVSNGNRQNL